MPSRHQKNICQCDSHLFSSVLLLLTIIFSRLSCAAPTTFITSVPQPPTPLTLNARQQNPNQNSPNTEPEEDTSSHINNYYFVIVAVFVVVVFFLLLLITRRRKQKAELLRNGGPVAIARDVQSFAEFRTRFGPRRGGPGLMGMAMGIGVHREPQEGLDDRGEAPPAYVEGDKPPSLRSSDGITMMISNVSHCNAPAAMTAGNDNTTGNDASGLESRLSANLSRQTTITANDSPRCTSIGSSSRPITSAEELNQDVELRPVSRNTSSRPPLGPPTYSETILGGQPELTRPAPAVTAHDRSSLTRD
ncbi:hypothetical protein EYC80_008380 [Monilinia laxa]|uniref:Uncharacterized protein n=1 Tax=Monilinia laxa TaxID=61186 RepID=A0A5N6JQ29_MONLA|nr:hypothetical protein EYC80_008380 [Monilinia laxa]